MPQLHSTLEQQTISSVYRIVLVSLQYALLVVPSLIIPLFLSRLAGAENAVPIQMVAATLCSIGVVTIMQAWRKVPLIGTGFFMPSVASAIYFPAALFALHAGGLPLLFTMTILAGLFEMFLGFIFHWLRSFFPSFLTGFVIMLVGISLGMLALHKLLDISHYHDIGYQSKLMLGVTTVFLMFALTVWGKGIFRLIAPLFGIIYGIFLAYLLGISEPIVSVNPEGLTWIQMPFPKHIHFQFNWMVVSIFLVSSLTSAIRATGVVTTCQSTKDNDYSPNDKKVQRGIITDGLGCAIAGLLGAPGISAAPSLVGLSLINGQTNRILGYTVGTILIILAFCPKLLYLFTFISVPVSGAALFFLGTIMTMSGFQLINADRASMRINLMLSLCLLIALSHLALLNFYQLLPAYMLSVTNSLLSLGVLFAIVFNIVLNFTYKKPIHLVLDKKIGETTAISTLLKKKLQQTGIPLALKEKVIRSISNIIKIIQTDYLSQQPLSIEIVCKTAITVRIQYTGNLYHLPEFSEEIDNEDAAFTIGLIRMYTAEQPDYVTYKKDQAHCQLILTYLHD